MTEVAVTTEDSPAWLKQRNSVLNSNEKSPKVLDKELARLKNMGAVSSVWTNKFVQEDNSGGRRPSYSSKSPSPTHENFNTRIRPLSGSKKIAEDISLLHQSKQNVDSRQHTKQQSSISSIATRFSKTSISSFDLTDNTSRTSLASDTDTVVVSPTEIKSLESIKSQYEECHALLTKANEQVEYYKIQLAQETSQRSELERTSKDEAAALWFQCETFKTQFAQIEAKLKKANADIESYKLQLEQNEQSASHGDSRVRQLAELVMKQESLLEEYEQNLESTDNLADVDSLRQELVSLNKQKESMEKTIESLRADIEMSHGQMRLMLVVSTEIQNEFESFKESKEKEIKELMSQRKEAHPRSETNTYYEDQINELKQALLAKDRVIADMQNQLRSQRMSMDAQMMELTESILEKDTLLMDLMSSRNNSREAVSPQQQYHPHHNPYDERITTTVAPSNITSSFYHPDEDDSTSRIQMARVREFMTSESDSDDDDEHQETIILRYSSDEDDDMLQQPISYYHMQHSDPTSPTSSFVSFESSEEEEKVAEIKHFSYSSVQSTRPVSLNSITGSLSGSDILNIKEWPMPPPTPPPSEPLPPVPSKNGIAPPPRRGRSRTVVRDEIDTSLFSETTAPVPPPRKAHLKLEKHRTSWMDDPEDSLM